MKEKYEYQLAPAYSIYHRATVVNQKGSFINFLVPYYEKASVKKKLRKSFHVYLAYVRSQPDCPESFKKETVVVFSYASAIEIKKRIETKMQKENAL